MDERSTDPQPADAGTPAQPGGRPPLCLGSATLFVAHTQPFTPLLLDLLRELGVVAVEIADYHANFDYDDAGWLDQARGWLADRGFALNSIHAHFERRRPGSNLASPNETVRRESVAIYRGGLAALARLGGDILVTHHVDIPPPEMEPEAHAQRRRAYVASLRELAPAAADLGVRLAVENRGSGWCSRVERVKSLVADAGDHHALGLCLDTGHQHRQGDVASAVRAAGSHLITLHIHDNHGEADEHLMPLDGTIAWSPVVAALVEIGYAGVFMYETGQNADIRRLPENYATLMALG